MIYNALDVGNHGIISQQDLKKHHNLFTYHYQKGFSRQYSSVDDKSKIIEQKNKKAKLDDDEEWNLKEHHHYFDNSITSSSDDTLGPPKLEQIIEMCVKLSSEIEEKKEYVDDVDVDKEVKRKFLYVFRMCEIYYKTNAQTIDDYTCSLLLKHLAEVMMLLIRSRDEMIKSCSPLILRLFSKYFKDINDNETVNPAIFTDVVFSLKAFGLPFRNYAEINDVHQNLLDITKIAIKLVPVFIPMSISKILDALGELRIRDEIFLNETVLHLQVNLELYSLVELAAVVGSFRKLNYYKSDKISQRLAKTIELKKNILSTRLIAKFIVSIGYLDWDNITEIFDILIEVAIKKIDEFTSFELTSVMKGLKSGRYCPNKEFLKQFCNVFIRKIDTFDEVGYDVCFSALAEFEYKDNKLIEKLKNIHMDKNNITSKSRIIQFGWSLSILNAFDEKILKWYVNRVNNVEESNLTDIEKRQIYQCLIHIYVLQPELAKYLDIDPIFEKSCAAVWKTKIKENAYTRNLVLSAFVSLRELGFLCNRSESVLGGRFNIAAIRHTNLNQKFKLSFQCGFKNNLKKLRGPQKWKNKILEKLGWTILQIDDREWNKLQKQGDKREFLKSRIKKLIDKRFAFLWGSTPEQILGDNVDEI